MFLKFYLKIYYQPGIDFSIFTTEFPFVVSNAFNALAYAGQPAVCMAAAALSLTFSITENVLFTVQ